MAILIAVANQKGGCGKTTTVMNLAGGLHKAAYRVLVVDADPQASAMIWSIARGQGSLPFDVHTSRQHKGRFRPLADSNDYDIVLIDCPPGVTDEGNEAGRVARAAIREADAILVPLRPSTLDFSAAASFVKYLVKEKAEDQKVLVLINGRQHTLIGRQAPDQAEQLFAPVTGTVILDTTIGLRAPITEVSGSGKTIFDYAPGHDAAREYRSLTKEIIKCLSNAQGSQQLTSQISAHSTRRSAQREYATS